MTEQDKLSRRQALTLGAIVVGTSGATLLGMDQFIRRPAIREARSDTTLYTAQLQDELSHYLAEIEKAGTGPAIARLTMGQDIGSYIGTKLYERDTKEAYTALFSSQFTHAGPAYGHHTPKYWDHLSELVTNIPEIPPLIKELSNRLNQHAAHFGTFKELPVRGERVARLLAEDLKKDVPYRGLVYSNVIAENLELFKENKKLQTERDIGLYYQWLQDSLVANISDEEHMVLIEEGATAINQWIDQAAPVLEELGIENDAICAVLKANPFV